jgi:hypothetical protein
MLAFNGSDYRATADYSDEEMHAALDAYEAARQSLIPKLSLSSPVPLYQVAALNSVGSS